MPEDRINHPSHYTSGPFECIELTERYPFVGGNAIKYVYRWLDKNRVEDLKKAYWYLTRRKPGEAGFQELMPLDTYACADDFLTDADAVRMLRKLARLDWQDMGSFWKGMAELACGYTSGWTRAVRALERRIGLIESPLTGDETMALAIIGDGGKPDVGYAVALHRLKARGLI